MPKRGNATTSSTIKYGATGGCFSPHCTAPRSRPCCYRKARIWTLRCYRPCTLETGYFDLTSQWTCRLCDLQTMRNMQKLNHCCVCDHTGRPGNRLHVATFVLPFPQECGRIMDVVKRPKGRGDRRRGGCVRNKRQHWMVNDFFHKERVPNWQLFSTFQAPPLLSNPAVQCSVRHSNREALSHSEGR